jgi:PKD repeat protein
MKKNLLFLFAFLFAAFTLNAQTYSYSDCWGNTGFNLVSTNPEKAEVVFSVPSFSLEDVNINGEMMKNVAMSGSFLFNDAGMPNLPGKGKYIAIPQGATPKLRIVSQRTETIHNVNIAPAPVIPLDNDPNPLEFNKNVAVYSANAYYPANPVQISGIQKIRGVDVVMLGFTPFQYNPVTRDLIVYKDIRVQLSFEGGNGQFGDPAFRSRWWEPILQDNILNFQSLPSVDFDKRVQDNSKLLTNDECEYIILIPTGSEFAQWADSLKNFRNQQGILTKVFTTAYVGGNTVSAIETWINNAYNTWTNPPAACLILADYGTDATKNIISHLYTHPAAYPDFASDNKYADVDNDEMPDIVFSRITANNATELQVMVSKVLYNERTPVTDPLYYDLPITALGWQTERWFQLCSEIVGGYFRTVHNKNPRRINAIYSGTPGTVWSTATNTSTIVSYFGPSGLDYIPQQPNQMPCCWTGGTATRINQAIDSGAFMLQHRDHGNYTAWGEPAYNTGNIAQLNNPNKLTFVFSINCETGAYHRSSECFGEKFHRFTKNGVIAGALGLVCPTETSYSFVNDTYTWGMYDNMWPDFMPAEGTTPASRGCLPAFGHAAGKYFLQQSSWPYNTGDKLVTYRLFHMLGDAFTRLYWEVPQALTISHSSTIQAGSTSFQVTANNYSFIALTIGDQILGTATGTGSPVNITIPGTLVAGQTMRVTVTMDNYFRYGANVAVVANGGPMPDFIADSTAICAGQNVDFTDLTTGNPISWSWTFPGGTPGTSTLQHPQNIVYSVPGTYNVTLTATNAVSSNSITKLAYIAVTNPANAPLIPDGDTALCQNNSNTLYTTMTVAGATGYSWVLTPDTAGVMTPGDTSCIVNWDDNWTGYASLKVMATNGCGASPFSPELMIHILPFPAIPNQPSGPAALCQGSPETSEYTTNSVPNATFYTWLLAPGNAGTIIWTDTAATVTWNAGFTGTASLKVKASNSCSESLWSTPLDLTVNPNPIVDLGDDITITQLQTTTLDAGNPGASYAWSNGAVTQTITVGYLGNNADTYFVDVTAGGCLGNDTVVVNFTDPVGIPDRLGKLAVIITPNPNNGQFRIDVMSAADKSFDLRIVSILGTVVYDLRDLALSGKYSSKIEVPGLHDGVYYIVVTTQNDKVTKKIVIQK